MNRENDQWIQTFTKRKVWPLDPRTEDIDIKDIAHALALQCRFCGQCKCFYSIAQHSVLVSKECDPKDARWGLLHDASEAYLTDVARPVKHHPAFDYYRVAEKRLMEIIAQKFHLDGEQPTSVTNADTRLLVSEAQTLMSPVLPGWKHSPENGYLPSSQKVKPVGPEEAEKLFLYRYNELF